MNWLRLALPPKSTFSRSAMGFIAAVIVVVVGWSLLSELLFQVLLAWHDVSAIWFTVLGERHTWGSRDAGHAELGPLASWLYVIELGVLALLTLVLGLIARGVILNLNSDEELAASATCEYCGYDLRASPGRCPECGKGRRGGP